MNKIKIFFAIILITMSNYIFAEKFYDGDGRSDLSIEVCTPSFSGNIDKDLSWMPEFITNLIVDDIRTYSAIKIIDNLNRKKVIDSLKKDDIFSKDSELIELGNFSVAKYLLLVNIIGKTNSYGVSLKIDNKETNETIVAYNNPNCSFKQLETGAVIKIAIEDLLEKLDVKLTDFAKESLHKEYSSQEGLRSIEAQKEVAIGTILSQEGNHIQALSHFIKANMQDDKLQRAIIAMSDTANVIATGDLGVSTRNLIQQRNDFKDLLEETRSFISETTPITLVYDSNLTLGNIDYDNEVADYDFKVEYVVSDKVENLISDIKKAYLNQPDHKNWKLDSLIESLNTHVSIEVIYELVNTNGKTVSKVTDTIGLEYKSSTQIQKMLSFKVKSEFLDEKNLNFRISKISKKTDSGFKVIDLETITIDDYIGKYILPKISMNKLANIDGVKVLSYPANQLENAKQCLRFFSKPTLYQLNKFNTCGKNKIIFYGKENSLKLPDDVIFNQNTKKNITISDLDDNEKIFTIDYTECIRERRYEVFLNDPSVFLKKNIFLFYRSGLGFCIGVDAGIYDLYEKNNKTRKIYTSFTKDAFSVKCPINLLDSFTILPDFKYAQERTGNISRTSSNNFIIDAYPIWDLNYASTEYTDMKEKNGYILTGIYMDKSVKVARTINLFSNIEVEYIGQLKDKSITDKRVYFVKVDKRFYNYVIKIASWYEDENKLVASLKNQNFGDFNKDDFIKLIGKNFEGNYSWLDKRRLSYLKSGTPVDLLSKDGLITLDEWIKKNNYSPEDDSLYLIIKTKYELEKYYGTLADIINQ